MIALDLGRVVVDGSPRRGDRTPDRRGLVPRDERGRHLPIRRPGADLRGTRTWLSRTNGRSTSRPTPRSPPGPTAPDRTGGAGQALRALPRHGRRHRCRGGRLRRRHRRGRRRADGRGRAGRRGQQRRAARERPHDAGRRPRPRARSTPSTGARTATPSGAASRCRSRSCPSASSRSPATTAAPPPRA